MTAVGQLSNFNQVILQFKWTYKCEDISSKCSWDIIFTVTKTHKHGCHWSTLIKLINYKNTYLFSWPIWSGNHFNTSHNWGYVCWYEFLFTKCCWVIFCVKGLEMIFSVIWHFINNLNLISILFADNMHNFLFLKVEKLFNGWFYSRTTVPAS